MKYLLTLYGPESDWADASPAEMEATMEPWNAFDRELTGAGALLAGEALQPSATATTVKHGEDDERLVTDGPFVETKEQLGGFYMLECGDLDEALAWAKKVPVGPGSTVEVRPVVDLTQFGDEHPGPKAEAAS